MKLNMKACVLLGTTGLVSSMPFVGWADVINAGPVTIHADTDGTHPLTENITFRIGGSAIRPNQLQMEITENGTTIYDGLTVIGGATVNELNINGGIIRNSAVNGNTVIIQDALQVTGSGGVGLDVNGSTTLDATTIDGTTTINGATTITGNTSVTGSMNVNGSTTLDATTIEGTANINTSGTNTSTLIGNASNFTTIAGTTTITGTTNINTAGTAATTIGNATSGTTVTLGGGSSSVSLANGQTSINTASGSANTSIGVVGNTTSILSTTVGIGNTTNATNVSIATGSAANTVSLGNSVGGTQITAAAGNTSMAMRNGSVRTDVAGGGSVAGGTLIANNGATRWIADSNGMLELSNDASSGTTAAMVVTNSEGNTHGLVIQETKTTLSGGVNSASMTLDDRGATFSDPANGAPIQVHGVADGTAPFDAVNVRQLYSGLAAVLASTPDIDLAPGRTGMAVGLGGYGGYGAIGIGFGHMYENGATLRASASKGAHSEVAYRASLSWNW